MKTITRRKFLNSSMTAGLALGMPRIVIGTEGSSRSPGPNDTVRVAVLGPETVDYDLWCGPAPKTPLMRKQLHYEWHWFWATGNGGMGNNGIHAIDISRWALGQNQPPPRAMSIGGRFVFNDCGETANTHIALLDYEPAPLICEARNVLVAKGPDAIVSLASQSEGKAS